MNNCRMCKHLPICRHRKDGGVPDCTHYVAAIPNRPTKDEYYLEIARAVSRRSTCLRRQYGAVIVNNDEIIATGYNGSPRGTNNCCDGTLCKRIGHSHNDGDYGDCESVHAEMNSMLSAARRDMIGATLYLYGEEDGITIDAEPCPICHRMILNAGIKRVIVSHKK